MDLGVSGSWLFCIDGASTTVLMGLGGVVDGSSGTVGCSMGLGCWVARWVSVMFLSKSGWLSSWISQWVWVCDFGSLFFLFLFPIVGGDEVVGLGL